MPTIHGIPALFFDVGRVILRDALSFTESAYAVDILLSTIPLPI